MLNILNFKPSVDWQVEKLWVKAWAIQALLLCFKKKKKKPGIWYCSIQWDSRAVSLATFLKGLHQNLVRGRSDYYHQQVSHGKLDFWKYILHKTPRPCSVGSCQSQVQGIYGVHYWSHSLLVTVSRRVYIFC